MSLSTRPDGDFDRLRRYREHSLAAQTARLLGDVRAQEQIDIDRAHAEAMSDGALARERALIRLGGLGSIRAGLRFDIRLRGRLRLDLGPVAADLAKRERFVRTKCRGETLGLQDVRARLRSESERNRRAELGEAEARLLRELHTPRCEFWPKVISAAARHGVQDWLCLAARTKRVSVTNVAAMAQEFLDQTREAYAAGCRRWAPDNGAQGMAPHDVPWLFYGASRWREVFPCDAVQRVRNFFHAVILPSHSAHAVAFASEDREGKTVRAFAAPIDPPTRIVIAHRPTGHHRDVEEILHELGHAAAFASIMPDARWEDRLLWNDIVQETFAFMAGRLVRNPAFLVEVLALVEKDAADYAQFSTFLELYLARRHAALVRFEVELHSTRNYRGAGALYGAIMTRALAQTVHEEQALEDLSEYSESMDYLCAWAKTARLARAMNGYFGPLWWCTAEAWRTLKPLWALGGRLTPRALLSRLGIDAEQTRDLVEDLVTVRSPG
jgi:hypothetical protein